MSIAQQKSDLKAIISRRIKRKLDAGNIEYVRSVASGACMWMASRMTLKELREWNDSLTIVEMMNEKGNDNDIQSP